ncbi:hypothetical protein PG996_005641 [Apiospora saccharicola]|uniref:Uncharacterized protein n=1 Tax=Apiospora saccharicola TaxID=335842 RepID=A0ABR1VM59_9PEZI
MPLIGKHSLNIKNSKGNMQISHPIEQHNNFHARSMSTSSTVSHASSTGSIMKADFNPLSLHPPLAMNTSPVLPEFDAESKAHHGGSTVQWPLKDWQAVPPGLAKMDEQEFAAQTTPRRLPNDQRRPPKDNNMSEMEMFVKRGEWKRKGIVFGLGSDYEDEQEQHFELPLPEKEPHFEFF